MPFYKINNFFYRVGVGFDTKGAGSFVIAGPNKLQSKQVVIDDSREGWVTSVEQLLNSYFFGEPVVVRTQKDYFSVSSSEQEIESNLLIKTGF
jgi:hypothetical protein